MDRGDRRVKREIALAPSGKAGCASISLIPFVAVMRMLSSEPASVQLRGVTVATGRCDRSRQERFLNGRSPTKEPTAKP